MTTMCSNCPRHCRIDRNITPGFCGATNLIKIAKVSKHYSEEPIISGKKGSGTIFFSHCNLKCVFCQNYDISHEGFGKVVSVDGLVQIFKNLEKAKVNNINLVSPTHYANEILQALKIYKPKIPVVYNTNGYDNVDTLKKLAPYIDIYLTDFKYCDNALSLKYSNCANYFEKATSAILQMRKNQPKDIIRGGLMKKGVIIRHLVLPTHTDDTCKVIDWVAKKLGDKTILNLMSQYVPMYEATQFPQINRKLKPLEYKRVVSYMIGKGLTNGYTQELSSATTSETPKFDLSGLDGVIA
ncbi:MAG: radical SAM protein [Clostridia bacterium]|nr:radical SAM protein [Clostridia bacterium]